MRKTYHSIAYISEKYRNYGEEIHHNIKSKYREIAQDIRIIGSSLEEKDYTTMIKWSSFLQQDIDYLNYLKSKANEIDRTR